MMMDIIIIQRKLKSNDIRKEIGMAKFRVVLERKIARDVKVVFPVATPPLRWRMMGSLT